MPDAKYNLEHELVSRRLLTIDALADAKMAAAAAGELLVETLLERRLIAEDTLLDLFHQRLGFPLVDDNYFDKLESDTLQLIPRELAIKGRVLPLYRSNDKLFVAAVDPTTPVLAEVAQAIGHQLIVCVARPSSILRALSLRYRAPELLRKTPKPKAKVEPIIDLDRPKHSSTISGKPANIVSGVSELDLPMTPVVPKTPPPKPLDLPPLPMVPDARPVDQKTDATLSEFFRNTPATVQQRPAGRRIPGPDDFERAKADLRAATDKDAIGRILTLFVARYFARVVLLAHKQQMLFGWQSVGTDLSASRLKGVIVPLHLASVFQHIVNNRTYHIGKIDPGMINSAFLAAIGDQEAGHALIVPILLEKRVATVLYADTAGSSAPNADLSLVYRMCDETGAALSELIRVRRGGPV